ncbi:MAG: hypothetical protein WBC04_15740 [Candidatus Acidiferrales bacterium]
MSVNVRLGFNRLYIVLATVWAAYCLAIYPRLQIREAMEQYGQNTAMCYDTQNYGPNEKAECVKRAESLFKIEVEPWSFKNFYRWACWDLLLAVVVLPLVLYGVCRGVAATGLWVWRGFQGTAP